MMVTTTGRCVWHNLDLRVLNGRWFSFRPSSHRHPLRHRRDRGHHGHGDAQEEEHQCIEHGDDDHQHADVAVEGAMGAQAAAEGGGVEAVLQ